jgi:hypothetical protein
LDSSRPPASFRPNLQRLTETDFIRPNNRQNYAYKVSSNWGQAIPRGTTDHSFDSFTLRIQFAIGIAARGRDIK